VIGSLGLLVLMVIATVAPTEMVSQLGSLRPAPTLAALRVNPPEWQDPDGLPVFLSIQNKGDEDDRLLGGSTPVAQSVEARRTFLIHGRRDTAPVPEGIVIPAEATITLEPAKCHLALYGLETDLVRGQTFPLMLRFERAGQVTVVARVRRRVDAAGTAPLPVVSVGDLTIARISAPPAPGP
jgi:copper(I)-binding protein